MFFTISKVALKDRLFLSVRQWSESSVSALLYEYDSKKTGVHTSSYILAHRA